MIFLVLSSYLQIFTPSTFVSLRIVLLARTMDLSLSSRDIHVLGKLRDPESHPADVRLDPLLPKDPHVTDPDEYRRLAQHEMQLVLALQQADMQLSAHAPSSSADPLTAYAAALDRLGQLIADHPDYASARNNRAQALRRLHGDDMLLEGDACDHDRPQAAAVALADLDRCIVLLSPADPQAALAPTAARTLSLALTQRAALYHATAKHMGPSRAVLPLLGAQDQPRPEARWTRLDFEEAAARDFALGGRLGNDLARGLAVSANPTAKLCGQMVQQMMRKEYGL